MNSGGQSVDRIDLPVMPLPPEPPPEDDGQPDVLVAELVRLARSLLELRSRQITGPEKRVADEAIALVRELLEDQ